MWSAVFPEESTVEGKTERLAAKAVKSRSDHFNYPLGRTRRKRDISRDRFYRWRFTICDIYSVTLGLAHNANSVQCSFFQCLGSNTRRGIKDRREFILRIAQHHSKPSVCYGLQPSDRFPQLAWVSLTRLLCSCLTEAVLSVNRLPLATSGREREGRQVEKGKEREETGKGHAVSSAVGQEARACVNVVLQSGSGALSRVVYSLALKVLTLKNRTSSCYSQAFLLDCFTSLRNAVV